MSTGTREMLGAFRTQVARSITRGFNQRHGLSRRLSSIGREHRRMSSSARSRSWTWQGSSCHVITAAASEARLQIWQVIGHLPACARFHASIQRDGLSRRLSRIGRAHRRMTEAAFSKKQKRTEEIHQPYDHHPSSAIAMQSQREGSNRQARSSSNNMII